MSEVILYRGAAPDTPQPGTVTIYAKIDGKLYWKDENGVETPFYPAGAGTGDLLSDGTVPMTANWNMGNFQITMGSLVLTAATGQPLQVTSTDNVTNLSADYLDGQHGAYYLDFGNFVNVPSFLAATDIDTLAELNAILTDATLGDASDFATAAQGATADSALQPGDIDTLAELNTLLTDATLGDAGDFATAAQGATADTALQPGASSDSLTEGSTNLLLTTAERDKIATIPDAQNNVQTGTTYTIQASDNGKNIVFTNVAAIAVTLPDTLALDFQCSIVQANTGVPTVTPNTDTINGAASGVEPAAQWKALYLTQFLDTQWMAIY